MPLGPEAVANWPAASAWAARLALPMFQKQVYAALA